MATINLDEATRVEALGMMDEVMDEWDLATRESYRYWGPQSERVRKRLRVGILLRGLRDLLREGVA